MPTSVGSLAVVVSTLPRLGHALHQWHHELQHTQTTLQPVNLHHSMTSELTPPMTSELTPLYDTVTLSTNYAFTLTRPGLPGCLMALAMVYPLDALTVFLGCKSCNLSTAYTNLDVVDAELGKEITAGRIINDPIKKEDLSVHYSSVNDAVTLLFQNGQSGHGQFCMDTCLPFGLCSAPSLFNNYANALHWIMASNYGAQLLHYLDDFLLVGPPSKDTCQEAMYRMLLVCDQLGIPVASEMLEGPTTTLIFLGTWAYCSTYQYSSLPPDKLVELTELTRSWLSNHKTTKRELLSLIW